MAADTRLFHASCNKREVVKSNVVYRQLINKLSNHDLQISESIQSENTVILFVLINGIYSELRMPKEFSLRTIEFMPPCINSIQNNTEWSV